MARDAYTILKAKGIEVAAISADSLESHHRYQQKLALPFPLLSDRSKEVCQLYRVRIPIIGISRTVFVIDQQGTILFRQKGTPKPEQIIQQLSL